MVTFDHIRGASFLLNWTLENDGQPVDITQWTIESQLRLSTGELIADLAVNVTNGQEGKFRVYHPHDVQTDWPIADLVGNIKMTDDALTVLPSEWFRVRVFKEVTV